jgi:hypothetical protein
LSITRRSVRHHLRLPAVGLHRDHRVVLADDAESAQREEPVAHFGRHFTGTDAVAKDLHLAGHGAGQPADLVQAGGIDSGFAHSLLRAADQVRLVEDQLHLRADRGLLCIRVAHEADHHRGAAHALRRRTDRVRDALRAWNAEVDLVRFVRRELVGRGPHRQPERVEHRGQHHDPVLSSRDAVDREVPVHIRHRVTTRALDEHDRLG